MTIESITKYDLNGVNQCELNENVGFNPVTQETEKAIRNRIHVEYELPLGQEYADLVVSFIE